MDGDNDGTCWDGHIDIFDQRKDMKFNADWKPLTDFIGWNNNKKNLWYMVLII